MTTPYLPDQSMADPDLRKGIAIISKIQGPAQLHTEPARTMAELILQNELDLLLGVYSHQMNNPKTAADWKICAQEMMKYQAKINYQIKVAFAVIMSLGNQEDIDFWDDHLHSPEDINGRTTDERWNKTTLRGLQAAALGD
jgi:hypothetical protein